ncbi:hypothetical protein FA09DRAFT_299552 [Tilletiopsis washingtonensis]|uniref:Hydrophobin n=1 Tax=Tilletiopsis washingtonensis TaxID=58919 RepID=A0A316Z5M1_9BASI|nr:hypothetical protein FA09DRAFT_299552 [Tilletiopsis washingtonensis]PWN96596.1 hypothetical protein FA09DRAFT_299552 [Tilletiopsis washingtonensis]
MRPKARRHATGQCSVGTPQCCNQVVHDQAKKDVFSALAGIKELTGPIALDCFQLPVNVIGAALAAQNTCKSTPMCCENVTQSGLVNFGCTNLPLN